MAENSKYLLNKFDGWDLNQKTMVDSYIRSRFKSRQYGLILAIAKLENKTTDLPLASYELKTRLSNNTIAD
jgi:hypothetical protein